MSTTKLVVELRPKENPGPCGIWTHDLCDTGVALYQLSLQAHIICNKVRALPWADQYPAAWSMRNLRQILAERQARGAVYFSKLGFRKSPICQEN